MRTLLLLLGLFLTTPLHATFSIVARDPQTGELGVAVASRFFSVGSVVPYASASAGAVATQANANVTYGPRGLELFASGLTAEEIVKVLLRGDDNAASRQVGLVGRDGTSASYTGPECVAWAGGRSGPNYAVQGNILASEQVVIAMEKAFLETKGSLARRMYAAMVAGDAAGGDSRGRQSASLMVVKEGAGFNGGNDRAIDIRVDDHAEPFKELGRLLDYAEMNAAWTVAWTAFTQKRYAEALVAQEHAAQLGANVPEVLYDLAVIRLAAGKKREALEALRRAIALNAKLKTQARKDKDLDALRDNPELTKLIQ